jgi:SPP1 gp7 family putative phage head morphogenesis protein
MCNAHFHKLLDLSVDQVVKAKKPADIALLDKWERVLAVRMFAVYESAAQKAIKKTMASFKGGNKDAKSLAKIVDGVMADAFSAEDLKNISRDITRFYVADKTLSMKLFGIKPDIKSPVVLKAKVESAFDLSDKRIVDGIQKQNNIAATNAYGNNYSQSVVDAISEVVGQVGLSNAEAGILLQRELSKSLGLTVKEVGQLAPQGQGGSAKSYFQGLARTTTNRSQNFSRVNLMSQAEITDYEIVAIIDKRTSDICLQMDGRRFSVKDGMAHIDSVLGAKTPSGLRQVAGWRDSLKELGIKNPLSGKTSSKISAILSGNGMALPPYHFRCRTQVRPVFK